tara:strand:- start:32257 stop:32445 length:189 start_codon:yes stop_codon:yes gene_type:complete
MLKQVQHDAKKTHYDIKRIIRKLLCYEKAIFPIVGAGYYTYQIDANNTTEQYGRLSISLVED